MENEMCRECWHHRNCNFFHCANYNKPESTVPEIHNLSGKSFTAPYQYRLYWVRVKDVSSSHISETTWTVGQLQYGGKWALIGSNILYGSEDIVEVGMPVQMP